jgi:hypothetical protein
LFCFCSAFVLRTRLLHFISRTHLFAFVVQLASPGVRC